MVTRFPDGKKEPLYEKAKKFSPVFYFISINYL